jgi:predicted HicB family RNase H-like nuclease
VRMPEDLAETAEVVARARGMSVNELVLDARKLNSTGYAMTPRSWNNCGRWSSGIGRSSTDSLSEISHACRGLGHR